MKVGELMNPRVLKVGSKTPLREILTSYFALI
jgi:hypothetical protein